MKVSSAHVKRVSIGAAMLFAVLCVPFLPASAAVADTDQSTVTVTLNAGDLVLTQVPSLDFSSHNIEVSDMSFDSTADYDIIVTDLRGTGDGWSLTAALDVFESGSNTDTLPGATMDIVDPVVAGSSATNLAEAVDVSFATDHVAREVFFAAAGNGMGEWTATWGTGKATLNIPVAGAHEGTHVANLDWVLNDAP